MCHQLCADDIRKTVSNLRGEEPNPIESSVQVLVVRWRGCNYQSQWDQNIHKNVALSDLYAGFRAISPSRIETLQKNHPQKNNDEDDKETVHKTNEIKVNMTARKKSKNMLSSSVAKGNGE